MVFLGPSATAELVPKFRVALHVSRATFRMVTSNFDLDTANNNLMAIDRFTSHRFTFPPLYVLQPPESRLFLSV
jgi:hypothetical protein